MTILSSARVGATPARAAPGRWREWLGGPVLRPIVVVVGSILLALAGIAPVWGTRLIAPQYPKGLELWFYGDRVEGPLREVNGLNHYIGMQAIDLARVPEMALWPLAVLGSAVLLVLAVLGRGWLSRLALLGLWSVPLVVLADIQRWLLIFGTELDPRAALRLEGFVPIAVGPTQVWNFSVLTYPGPALVLIALVALAATLARRARPAQPAARRVAAVGALLIAGLGSAVLVVPAMAAAVEEPPHHAHGAPVAPRPQPTAGDLQSLVDATPGGSELRVPPGSYRVHLVIDKPLTLVSEGDVWLEGSGIGSVVTVTGDDVTLRGFHIAATGGQIEVGAAIKVVEAARVSIEDNHLHDFFHGIVALSSRDLRIRGNVLEGSAAPAPGAHDADHGHAAVGSAPATHAEEAPDASETDPRALPADAAGGGPGGQGDGIYLWHSRAATIADNEIDRVRDGIYLSFADDVLVDGNRVTGSRYALHSMFGRSVTVFGNTARENLAGLVFMYTEDVLAGRNGLFEQRSAGTGVGIILKDVRGVRVAENVLARNRIGLRAEGTRRLADAEAAVLRNRFASNDTAVSLLPSADLGFGANTFDDNLTDVAAQDRGVSRQNDWTYQGTGNRWSGYAGYDLDGDDVGDVPHTASGALGLITASAPALQLYRGSLALHALDSAQELWEAGRTVIVHDGAPRIADRAPLASDLDPAEADVAGVDGDAAGWYLAGVSLALLALLGVALGRSRRGEAAGA